MPRSPIRTLSRLVPLCLALAALAAVVPGAAPTRAQDAPVRIRFASLAPADSPIGREFRRLDRELRERTGGNVRIHLYAGGAAGDERTIVRKMRDGQLDGAALTAVGLGAIAREVRVLQAPGLITTYPELDRVRRRMQPHFDAAFAREGFTLLGWGDAGRIRLFSTRRIQRPGDLQSARPWVWRDSPTMGAFVTATGATGVTLGVPEVLPALSTGMVDTVISSSVSAIAMQWHARLRTMSEQASGVVVGGVVVKTSAIAAIPEDVRAWMQERSRQNESEFRRAGRRLDERATAALRERLEVVDLDGYRTAWQATATRARDSLVGRFYSEAEVARVQRILEAP